MSTKIFYAYRVQKSEIDLMEMLWEFSEIATDEVANNGRYLKKLHTIMLLKAAEDRELYKILENEHPKFRSKFRDGNDVMEDYFDQKESYFFTHYLSSIFDSTSTNDYSSAINRLINEARPHFEVVIGMDNEYYYLKFFPNNIFTDILSKIIDEFPEIEDFHYQNQTDPPEDVPYEEFEKRDDKWDELTGPVDNYTRMLSYDVFGMVHLKELISKNWYSGKEDMYEHLAYQFDDYTIATRKKESIEVSLDPYRTKGVKIFSGYDRGKVVAEEIKSEYGENVKIIIPQDVYAVTRSFRKGFYTILNNKLFIKKCTSQE